MVQLAVCAADALPMGQRLCVWVVAPDASDLGARIFHALDRDRTDCTIAVDLAKIVKTNDRPDIVFIDHGIATDSSQQLESVKRALAPDGLLVVLRYISSHGVALASEVVAPPWGDSGSIYVETALAREQWLSVLESCGFVSQFIIEDVAGMNPAPFLLLSRCNLERSAVAGDVGESDGTPISDDAWIVTCAGSDESLALAQRLCDELLKLGQRVELLRRDVPSALPWGDALSDASIRHGRIAGIVALPVFGREAGTPSAIMERQSTRCDSLARLFDACSVLGIDVPIWIVTAQAVTALLPEDVREGLGESPAVDDAPIWGFTRAACNEYPALSLRLADLAVSNATEQNAVLLAAALLDPDAEDEAILTPFGRFVTRIDAQPLSRVRGAAKREEREATHLEIALPGQLKNLGWIRSPLLPLGEDDVEIEVRAAGLNFRDVMYAMGQLGEEALENGFAGVTLGMELTGVVAAVGARVQLLVPGDRVLACSGASFGTRVVTRANYVHKMPLDWSFEAGATVPVAFLTAHYALNHLAHLKPGERVLIHGAAGGVGMAAIQLARDVGAEIFATAGSEAKRDIVRMLGADHVLDSRTLDFAEEILARTGGRGIDVVLNSLAGEAMFRSLQILSPFGRFLELGKRDYYENSRFGMRPFRNNIAYFGIDLDQLMGEQPTFMRRMMDDLLKRFESGTLSPLPFRAFSAVDAEAAFRCMQQSRQIGKIVLRMDSAPQSVNAAAASQPGMRLPADATYLVTGGLGGFGLRTARWLAEKGARHLVLIGRSAPDQLAEQELAALAAAGVSVRAERCDVADNMALQRLLLTVQSEMPPLRGIVHAAGVIRAGLIRNLDREQIDDVLVPKVIGALNLDRLTQSIPLDFFVLYSSAATTFGNGGQAHYSGANCFLEALTEARRAKGQPALSVGWGPIADVGYLERNPVIREQMATRMGVSALNSAQALDALETLLVNDISGAAVLKISRNSIGKLAATSRSTRFSKLTAHAAEATTAAVTRDELEQWLAEPDDATLAAKIIEPLRQEAATILCLPADKLDATQPLQEVGFDSLMGVELILAIEVRFGVRISSGAVSEFGSLEKLAARLVSELRRDRPQVSLQPVDTIDVQARRLASQHNAGFNDHEVAAAAAQVAHDTRRAPVSMGIGE
jgi:NADPH:quinone reductase-like Zn-dependent oxidoreductase/acyl carrier protein